jgi:hypothetical protein
MGIKNQGNSFNKQCAGNGLKTGSTNNFEIGNVGTYGNGIHYTGGIVQGGNYGTQNNVTLGGISGISNAFVGTSSPNYNSYVGNTALTSDFVADTNRTLLNTPKKPCYR